MEKATVDGSSVKPVGPENVWVCSASQHHVMT